jgi:FkbM family methyltransferase
LFYSGTAIRAILLFQRHFKNWVPIMIRYVVGKRPSKIVLRNGQSIETWPGFPFYSFAKLLSAGWALKDIDDKHVVLVNSSGVSIKCRYREGYDIGHLDEIFLQESYGSDFSAKTVVDVGMSNGDSAIYFAVKGAKKVIGLEPNPSSFYLALGNIRANNLGGIIAPVNMALSSKRGTFDFVIPEDSPQTAHCRTGLAPSSVALSSTVEVNSTTLDDLVREFSLESIEFLKMDCEGCEYEVIKSAPPAVLKKIRKIRMEFHHGPQDLPVTLEKNGLAIEHMHESHRVDYLEARRVEVSNKPI